MISRRVSGRENCRLTNFGPVAHNYGTQPTLWAKDDCTFWIGRYWWTLHKLHVVNTAISLRVWPQFNKPSFKVTETRRRSLAGHNQSVYIAFTAKNPCRHYPSAPTVENQQTDWLITNRQTAEKQLIETNVPHKEHTQTITTDVTVPTANKCLKSRQGNLLRLTVQLDCQTVNDDDTR